MRWDKEKLSKPDSHVYGENGAKIMVYNMKRNPKKDTTKEKQRKSKFKKDNSKRKNFVLRIRLFWLSRG